MPTQQDDNTNNDAAVATQDDNQPKGEVRGKAIAPDDISDWGNEARIVEPNVRTEKGEIIEKDRGDQDDAGGSDDEDKDESEGQEETDEAAVSSEDLETEEPLQAQVEDPGEYQPADYSFEVVTYDKEGKNPSPHTISNVEEWDKLLQGEPNFGSSAALAKGMRQATKMETSLEQDKKDYDKKKTEFDETQKKIAEQEETTKVMFSEIEYLVSKGQLPKVDDKYKDADWTDPEVAKQPGVKEQVALLKYMVKESNARRKAGLKPITSVLDAWNAYQLDQRQKQGAKNKKVADAARKAAGAMVASGSPAPTSAAPKGVAIGRGGSLRDIGNDQNWSTGQAA